MRAADSVSVGVAGLLSLMLKHYAAGANADDLAFLLAPTARLVELASGHHFVWERGSGAFSAELALVIAPSCAGINYSIAVFMTLIAAFVPRLHGRRHKLAFALSAASIAYVATLGVNAARILVTIARGESGWLGHTLSREALHRFEGIVIYLGSLLALALFAEKLLFRGATANSRALLAFPLGAYLGVALLVPALNGAALRPAFWSHALVVLLTSVGLWFSARAALRHLSERRSAVPPC